MRIKLNNLTQGLGIENLGFDTSGLATIINNTVNYYIADYKGRIGSFLGLEGKIIDLRNRANALGSNADKQKLSIQLVNYGNEILNSQKSVEAQGVDLMNGITALQNNTELQKILKGQITINPIDPTWWIKMSSLNDQVKYVTGKFNNLFSKIENHKESVADYETQIIKAETTATPIEFKPYLKIEGIPTWVLIVAPLGMITLFSLLRKRKSR